MHHKYGQVQRQGSHGEVKIFRNCFSPVLQFLTVFFLHVLYLKKDYTLSSTR